MKKRIQIEATVFNPKNIQLNKDVVFLVDTGADSCVIPKSLADELRIPFLNGSVSAELANGRIVEAHLAYVGLEVGGELIITLFTVIDGEVEPLLGFDVMDLLDFSIDVRRRKVRKTFRSFRIIKRDVVMRLRTPEKKRGEG